MRYFRTEPDCGLFVRPSSIAKLDLGKNPLRPSHKFYEVEEDPIAAGMLSFFLFFFFFPFVPPDAFFSSTQPPFYLLMTTQTHSPHHTTHHITSHPHAHAPADLAHRKELMASMGVDDEALDPAKFGVTPEEYQLILDEIDHHNALRNLDVSFDQLARGIDLSASQALDNDDDSPFAAASTFAPDPIPGVYDSMADYGGGSTAGASAFSPAATTAAAPPPSETIPGVVDSMEGFAPSTAPPAPTGGIPGVVDSMDGFETGSGAGPPPTGIPGVVTSMDDFGDGVFDPSTLEEGGDETPSSTEDDGILIESVGSDDAASTANGGGAPPGSGDGDGDGDGDSADVSEDHAGDDHPDETGAY